MAKRDSPLPASAAHPGGGKGTGGKGTGSKGTGGKGTRIDMPFVLKFLAPEAACPRAFIRYLRGWEGFGECGSAGLEDLGGLRNESKELKLVYFVSPVSIVRR